MFLFEARRTVSGVEVCQDLNQPYHFYKIYLFSLLIAFFCFIIFFGTLAAFTFSELLKA